MQHTMQTMLLNDKLFWSPIGPSPQKILDLGTGTGNTPYIPIIEESVLLTLAKEYGLLRWRTCTPLQRYR